MPKMMIMIDCHINADAAMIDDSFIEINNDVGYDDDNNWNEDAADDDYDDNINDAHVNDLADDNDDIKDDADVSNDNND